MLVITCVAPSSDPVRGGELNVSSLSLEVIIWARIGELGYGDTMVASLSLEVAIWSRITGEFCAWNQFGELSLDGDPTPEHPVL